MSQQDEKSRSQIKREFLELKELGKQLSRLSPGLLRAMPLSDKTLGALLATSAMTRGALQRQYRYLAALLSEEDTTKLRTTLAGELKPTAEKVAAFHETEHWRKTLLSADEKQISEFIEDHPECDRTHLRQLIRNAKKEREQAKPPKSTRQLFRYLRELLEPPSE